MNLFTFFDSSRLLGSPVTLLRFSFGENADEQLGYTNNEQDITFGGLLYEAVALDRDSIKFRGINGRNEFTVRIPNDTEISNMFRFFPPPFPVSLTVFTGHRTDPNTEGRFQSVWTGRVLSAKPAPTGMTTVNCEWAGVSLRRNGATRNWQISCPFSLYGPDCRADRVAATVSTVVTGVDGFQITVPVGVLERTGPFGDTLGPDTYENGTVTWEGPNGTESRSILEVNGLNTLTLSNRPVGIQTGTPIDVAYGCNRLSGLPGDEGDCATVHNNISNFGGYDHIPVENPVNRNNF